MTRERALKVLNEELRSFKNLYEISRDKNTKKFFKEKIEAYELLIKEFDNEQPKVFIIEYQTGNKKWCIDVKVNDELIDNENIEFISNRDIKENGQAPKKKKSLKSIIRKWFRKGRWENE